MSSTVETYLFLAEKAKNVEHSRNLPNFDRKCETYVNNSKKRPSPVKTKVEHTRNIGFVSRNICRAQTKHR